MLNEVKETDNDNQLWFLNQEGQLVSKISKVAASISVTDQTEGEEDLALSQRWIFEDEKIMSSLNNLYMEADGNGDIKMKSSSDSKRQLWTPVPVDMLYHYKLRRKSRKDNSSEIVLQIEQQTRELYIKYRVLEEQERQAVRRINMEERAQVLSSPPHHAF